MYSKHGPGFELSICKKKKQQQHWEQQHTNKTLIGVNWNAHRPTTSLILDTCTSRIRATKHCTKAVFYEDKVYHHSLVMTKWQNNECFGILKLWRYLKREKTWNMETYMMVQHNEQSITERHLKVMISLNGK